MKGYLVVRLVVGHSPKGEGVHLVDGGKAHTSHERQPTESMT